jgi:hypothetical protein
VRLWVGFDVGKMFHWVCVLDDEGATVLSKRVGADERELEACLDEIRALGAQRMVAIDLLGDSATMLWHRCCLDAANGCSSCPGWQ